MKEIITVGVLILLVCAMAVAFWTPSNISRKDRQLKRLLQEAAATMSIIGVARSIDEVDILTEHTKTKISTWLSEYRKYEEKNGMV